MKRLLHNAVISSYILAMVSGLLAISLHLAVPGQTFLYFVTFNMFCGWSCFEARVHLIGEGESGTFYEVGPGPWSEFHPYGVLARQHYSAHFEDEWPIVENTLRHTTHEPIARVILVEEEYPKRLNIPSPLYEAYYNKPKVFQRYFSTRFVYDSHGHVLSQQPEWLRLQDQVSIADNPRLLSEASQHRSVELTDGASPIRGVYAAGRFYEPGSHIGTPLAE
jgi:hypothetical protein